MKSIFVFHSNGEPDLDWSPWPSREGAESYVKDELVEYVPLTPRVRLGLWLAEDSDRVWDSSEKDGVIEVELDGGSTAAFARGTGPTIDAAIEDALSKLPKEAK